MSNKFLINVKKLKLSLATTSKYKLVTLLTFKLYVNGLTNAQNGKFWSIFYSRRAFPNGTFFSMETFGMRKVLIHLMNFIERIHE